MDLCDVSATKSLRYASFIGKEEDGIITLLLDGIKC